MFNNEDGCLETSGCHVVWFSTLKATLNSQIFSSFNLYSSLLIDRSCFVPVSFGLPLSKLKLSSNIIEWIVLPSLLNLTHSGRRLDKDKFSSTATTWIRGFLLEKVCLNGLFWSTGQLMCCQFKVIPHDLIQWEWEAVGQLSLSILSAYEASELIIHVSTQFFEWITKKNDASLQTHDNHFIVFFSYNYIYFNKICRSTWRFSHSSFYKTVSSTMLITHHPLGILQVKKEFSACSPLTF